MIKVKFKGKWGFLYPVSTQQPALLKRNVGVFGGLYKVHIEGVLLIESITLEISLVYATRPYV